MAEKRESNISSLSVKVNVDCSEALKGLKAVTRAAKKATNALKELEEIQSKLGKSFNIPVTLNGKEVSEVVATGNDKEGWIKYGYKERGPRA